MSPLDEQNPTDAYATHSYVARLLTYLLAAGLIAIVVGMLELSTGRPPSIAGIISKLTALFIGGVFVGIIPAIILAAVLEDHPPLRSALIAYTPACITAFLANWFGFGGAYSVVLAAVAALLAASIAGITYALLCPVNRIDMAACAKCGYLLRDGLEKGCPECGWRRSTTQQASVSIDELENRDGWAC